MGSREYIMESYRGRCLIGIEPTEFPAASGEDLYGDDVYHVPEVIVGGVAPACGSADNSMSVTTNMVCRLPM